MLPWERNRPRTRPPWSTGAPAIGNRRPRCRPMPHRDPHIGTGGERVGPKSADATRKPPSGGGPGEPGAGEDRAWPGGAAERQAVVRKQGNGGGVKGSCPHLSPDHLPDAGRPAPTASNAARCATWSVIGSVRANRCERRCCRRERLRTGGMLRARSGSSGEITLIRCIRVWPTCRCTDRDTIATGWPGPTSGHAGRVQGAFSPHFSPDRAARAPRCR